MANSTPAPLFAAASPSPNAGVPPASRNAGILPAVSESTLPRAPLAVIELKGSYTDLDTDRSNGRTPVQQLFDCLNGLPDTNWGILSNFSTIGLCRE